MNDAAPLIIAHMGSEWGVSGLDMLKTCKEIARRITLWENIIFSFGGPEGGNWEN